MQRTMRINECQFVYLANKARQDATISAYLWKKSSDNVRWVQRFFALYQNYLFYYENEAMVKPIGCYLLEGAYCEHVMPSSRTSPERQFVFVISFRGGGDTRQFELACDDQGQCDAWVAATQNASFNVLRMWKEEVEQKYQHLLRISQTEQHSLLQYRQQCEEQAEEIAKLRSELSTLKMENQKLKCGMNKGSQPVEEETEELRHIKKVQSMMRGWLCRRRWKTIVEEYIKSPHADLMRTRNRLVFAMIEAEETYVEQLTTLVTVFYRTLKMAASSKKPLISHEDVNSIFLNCETILFLHQIFRKGLNARLDAWPKLILGDLFDMLLPMLSIYQEYVRNHHYSLQVLAECKQRPEFSALLQRYEDKPVCQGRSLETYLTFPMHQIPRYIVSLHQVLAHTPHDHVERKSLEYAKHQLEQLSNAMHDEVSETENIRKNLAIERQIVEGCDILLDVQQIFIRQGTLLQLTTEYRSSSSGGGAGGSGKASSAGGPGLGKKKNSSNQLLSSSEKKDSVKQCFLFSNHLIVTSRSSNGKLHLAKIGGKVPLADATLLEDETVDQFDLSNNNHPLAPVKETSEYDGREFKLVVCQGGNSYLFLFVAPTNQEKEAWVTDIGQCIENIHFSGLLTGNVRFEESSSIRMLQSVRSDPHLFKDDDKIKFSRSTNSCRVPQIRYATVDKLFDRLIDVRFLSIEFLNTFLMTYRYFTTAEKVMEVLRSALFNPEQYNTPLQLANSSSLDAGACAAPSTPSPVEQMVGNPSTFRIRKNTAPSIINSINNQSSDAIKRRINSSRNRNLSESQSPSSPANGNELNEPGNFHHDTEPLLTAGAGPGGSAELNEYVVRRHHMIPKQTSVESDDSSFVVYSIKDSDSDSLYNRQLSVDGDSIDGDCPPTAEQGGISEEHNSCEDIPPPPSKFASNPGPDPEVNGAEKNFVDRLKDAALKLTDSQDLLDKALCSSEGTQQPKRFSLDNYVKYPPRNSSSDTIGDLAVSSPKKFAPVFNFRSLPREGSGSSSQGRGGVVITSSRKSTRRSSLQTAAAAFAAATAGGQASRSQRTNGRAGSAPGLAKPLRGIVENAKKCSILTSATTMRVLHVLRHWSTKLPEDFEEGSKACDLLIALLNEAQSHNCLSAEEEKIAKGIFRALSNFEETHGTCGKSSWSFPECITNNIPGFSAQTPTVQPSLESIPAMDIALSLTYIEHRVFAAIPFWEFFNQAWVKDDKNQKAPHVLLTTKRFNDVSTLVSTTILREPNEKARALIIEKWAGVADICKYLHNFNTLLEIMSAFGRTPVYRLRKTWERVSKQVRATIEKLQSLVSSDGHFKNMRDALHKCDPPALPYLGMYLTDLTFIEDGTPMVTADGLINFSRMRMISGVVQEIRLYQQTPYTMQTPSAPVLSWLLQTSHLWTEEQMYSRSLELEPRPGSAQSTSSPC